TGTIDLMAFSWPPDAFAIAATVLRESGAYLQAARPHDYPDDSVYHSAKWPGHVTAVAAAWRSQDNFQTPPPPQVETIVREIGKLAVSVSLSELSRPDRHNLSWLPF